MVINIKNFFNSANNNSKLGDFQDLEHLDGVSISTTSANLSGQDPLLDCMKAADSLCTSEHAVLGVDGRCHGGLPSTLIAWHTVCDSPESLRIEVVREGKVSTKEILAWWKRRT